MDSNPQFAVQTAWRVAAAAATLALASAALSADASARALARAISVDLLAPPAPDAALPSAGADAAGGGADALAVLRAGGAGAAAWAAAREGALVAVSGAVALASGSLPVRSLNGEACVVAEDIVQVRRTSLGSASSSEFVRRTFRDAPFELGSSFSATTTLPASAVAASAAAAPPLSVAVERDAVQQQLSASISGPGSVRRLLVPGGSTVEANEASTLERLARLLVGVVEGDSQLRARRVLHLGFAMTAAGRLEMRGGKLVLCAHPQLGFWLLPRHGVDACAAQLRRSALLAWLGAAGVTGLALWLLFDARALLRDASDALTWARAEAAFRLGLAPPEVSPRRALGGAGTGGPPASSADCCICLDKPAVAVLVPCGHRALCCECAARVANQRAVCPVCRGPFREVIRVFDA